MAKGRTVAIDGARIRDWETYFDVFAEAFEFPSWSGRNHGAWVDLFTFMDGDLADTGVRVAPGEIVTIRIDSAKWLKERAPEQYEALLEEAAFVNGRRIEAGEEPFLCVAFFEGPYQTP